MQNEGITSQASNSTPDWAEKIKQKRKTLGESQAVFARRWNVSQVAVSDWERGVSEPPAAVLWWVLNPDEEASDA